MMLAKETRTGLPMVMARNKANGETLSLGHIAEGIGDKNAANQQRNVYRCDEDCQYGAVGIYEVKKRRRSARRLFYQLLFLQIMYKH